jgi:hypothetical protein|nr:MAG TPA: hypothetical protein [Caudoviricetes sp.]
MNKLVLATMIMGAIGGNVLASGVVTGPVEPNTQAPVVSGYNSVAVGANTVVTGTNTIVLGRDNKATGNDSIVIGGGNGTIEADQASVIGYNNYVGNNKEQTVLGANNTVDNQGAVVVGTHSVVRGIDAVVIGNNASAPIQNSVAIGTNSQTDNPVGVRQVVLNGVTHVFAGENPNSVVSFGSKKSDTYSGISNYNRQLHNVSAGRVDPSSLDAVNGSQLFAAYDEIETNGTHIAKLQKDVNCLDKRVTRNTTNISNLTSKVDNGFTTIDNTLNATNERVGQNSQAILNNTDRINNHETRITDLERNTVGQISNVMHEVAKAGASNAALSALHYLGYNSDDKLTFAVGYGHYKNANDVALGAFYAPTEHVMFSLGATLANKMINAGVSFRLGKGSEYELNHKGKIKQLEELVTKLVAEVEELKAGK